MADAPVAPTSSATTKTYDAPPIDFPRCANVRQNAGAEIDSCRKGYDQNPPQ
jgi:hypothetical protein